MNTKKLMLVSFICIAHCNVYAMEKSHFYGIKESISVMEKSDFQTFTQTSKFQEMIKKPEFFILMQTSEFQALMKAMHSQSYDHIQEALEGLLETEALQLIFETGIFSDTIRIQSNILLKTDAYAEYKHIKRYHKSWATADIQSVLNDCKTALRNAKEYTDLIDAVNKEMNSNTSHTSSDTKTSLTRAEQAFLKMEQTPQYQAYNHAKQLHEKHNTLETKKLLVEASKLSLATKETQSLLQIKNEEQEKNNKSQIYSYNVVAKNRAMEETLEHQQYQQAKAYHKKHNTADSQAMLDFCKEQFHSTKECQEFVKAVDQEAHVTKNIINSEKWKSEQKHSSPELIACMQNRKDNAQKAFQNTKEYKLFKDAQTAHKKHGAPLTQTLLTQCEHLAKKTPEYIRYFKIDQQLREAKEELQKNNARLVKREYRANNNQSTINDNATASSTPQPQSHTTTLSFQDQELNTYQNPKWLREQINKIAKDKNKAWVDYINTNEYKHLEQTKKQKPCPDTFLSIADAQERAYKTQQARDYRKLNGQLNYLDKELNKLIKNEHTISKHQNQQLRLSNSNSNNNNA
jgi:hypothetical protein